MEKRHLLVNALTSSLEKINADVRYTAIRVGDCNQHVWINRTEGGIPGFVCLSVCVCAVCFYISVCIYTSASSSVLSTCLKSRCLCRCLYVSLCFYVSVYFCVSLCICKCPQKPGHVGTPAPLSLILSSLSTEGVGGISLAGRGRPGTCRREIPETRLAQIHEIQSHAGNFPAAQPPRSRSPTFPNLCCSS